LFERIVVWEFDLVKGEPGSIHTLQVVGLLDHDRVLQVANGLRAFNRNQVLSPMMNFIIGPDT